MYGGGDYYGSEDDEYLSDGLTEKCPFEGCTRTLYPAGPEEAQLAYQRHISNCKFRPSAVPKAPKPKRVLGRSVEKKKMNNFSAATTKKESALEQLAALPKSTEGRRALFLKAQASREAKKRKLDEDSTPSSSSSSSAVAQPASVQGTYRVDPEVISVGSDDGGDEESVTASEQGSAKKRKLEGGASSPAAAQDKTHTHTSPKPE
jgi:hypothetical protein